MRLTRRTFFKLTGAAGATAVAATTAEASSGRTKEPQTPAVLVDTTRCVGCRACEAACAEANALAQPYKSGDAAALDTRRSTDPAAFTVVNRFDGDAKHETRFVKKQCMHCLEPGCASACLVRAIEKTPEGPVVYHKDRCLGCRYCMVACPFDVPKFEYDSATPLIRKCTFCAERQAQGLPPACASVCPSGALTFGRRDELLLEAKRRVYGTADKYEPHIFGEHEVGGTSWIYISDRPLDQLGFNGEMPTWTMASLTQPALAAVPFVLTLWPPLLMGLYTFSQRRARHDHDDTPDEEARHA